MIVPSVLRKTRPAALLLIAAALGPAACSRKAPDRVTVQHILIAFKGSIPDGKVTRSVSEARELAFSLFERARKGEDFDALVKQYTDDEYPGIYGMSNLGIDPDPSRKEYARNKMVKAFGDVSFGLKVGALGLAEHDPKDSKYGWHIIKRLS